MVDWNDFEEGLTVIWHDARTPLAAALGYLETLLEGRLGALTEDQSGALDTVRRSCRLIGELLNHSWDYLHLSLRPEALEMYWEPLSLIDMVNESLQNLYSFSYGPIDPVSIFIPADLPPIRGDRRYSRRALDYLLGPLSPQLQGSRRIEAHLHTDGSIPVEVLNQIEPVHRDKTEAELGPILFHAGSRLRSAAAILEKLGSRLQVQRSGHYDVVFRFTFRPWEDTLPVPERQR